jgi:protein O-mannosyl-transferase
MPFQVWSLVHLLNIVLVFYFVFRLTNQKFWLAFIVALLFGLHPLHVESVAWVAERKDVLYTTFFLLGLIAYLKYLNNKSLYKLLLVILFFGLSLMSKPAAVIFPVVLLAVDYYFDRLKTLKTYLEKIPFFLLAFILGFMTLKAQAAKGAVSEIEYFSYFTRFLFGFYGLMMYTLKTILPINLCTFYPYPPINQSLPMPYYVSLIFGFGLIVAFVYFFKKQKIFAFGIAFFVINLLLVLQFFPVGSAVMADRYTYVPLIGLFLIPAYFLQKMVDKNNGKLPTLGIGILAIGTLLITFLANRQAATWVNGAALWDKAIAVEPSSRAFNNRGLIYKNNGENDKAIEMYNQALAINKVEADALLNRGNIYFNQGKDELALADYRAVKALKPTDAVLFSNIGGVYGRQNKLDSSLYYLNESMKLDPTIKGTYMNRGFVYNQLNKYPEAIEDYKKYLVYDETNEQIMGNIGVCYTRLNNQVEAITWFTKAIAINPNGLHYLNRSFAYFNAGNKINAKADALKAKQLGEKVDEKYLNAL